VDSRARRIPKATMKWYFKNSAGQITHLSVKARLPFSLFAPNLAQYCKRLQHLELDISVEPSNPILQLVLHSLELRTLICGSNVELGALEAWNMLRKLRTIRHVEFRGLVNAQNRAEMQEELQQKDPNWYDLAPLEELHLACHRKRSDYVGESFTSWTRLLVSASAIVLTHSDHP
jgi:hypothetical protein